MTVSAIVADSKLKNATNASLPIDVTPDSMIIVLTSALWEDHGTEGPPPAAAKAVAATVEGIAEVIAAGGWVVLVILAVIIIIFVIIMEVIGC